MATRTITRLYDNHDEATGAVQALEVAGVPHSDSSLVGSAHDRAAEGVGGDTATTDAGSGAATCAGVCEEDAHVYAEGVRRGGAMLTARVEEGQAARVESLLASSGGHVDVAARRSEYRSEGWNRFNPSAPALTAGDVQAERKRRVRVS